MHNWDDTATMKLKEIERGNRKNQKSKKKKQNLQRQKRGPRLPSSLQKQIDRLNPTTPLDSANSDDDNDLYEYEEERAEEESRKNKRYDPVSVNDDLSEEIEVSLFLIFFNSNVI
ncbi:hypothetical protein V8G54_020885 [Vigna mungo]|uniref:Uncharacterized protein n=1 Tax=Vigna mungo TaxID=3915 RepID=A0AAQ3RTS3_VIGMU